MSRAPSSTTGSTGNRAQSAGRKNALDSAIPMRLDTLAITKIRRGDISMLASHEMHLHIHAIPVLTTFDAPPGYRIVRVIGPCWGITVRSRSVVGTACA